ncbi:Hypothetical protein (plasmid) [Pseudomonas putida]|nr:Hypothetical protein [Pseudomonas putida]
MPESLNFVHAFWEGDFHWRGKQGNRYHVCLHARLVSREPFKGQIDMNNACEIVMTVSIWVLIFSGLLIFLKPA